MAECPEERLPPDIDLPTESDQTEADSEFVENDRINETENIECSTADGENPEAACNVSVDDGTQAVSIEDQVDPTENQEENVSLELEHTESSGSVRADLLTAENDALAAEAATEETGD